MKVSILKKVILDDKLGRLTAGQIVDLPEHKAMFYIDRKDAELYETKVLRENPYKAAGTVVQSSALPAALVLPTQTSSLSESGEKRRGRPKKDL
jgi:hypothetical protein